MVTMRTAGAMGILRSLSGKVSLLSPTNIRMSEHFDVIIISTGAGGGLLHRLAPSGKRI